MERVRPCDKHRVDHSVLEDPLILVLFSAHLADGLRHVSEYRRRRFHAHTLRPLPVAWPNRLPPVRSVCAVQFRPGDILRHSISQVHCGMDSKSPTKATREYGRRKAGGSRHCHRAKYVDVVDGSEHSNERYGSTTVKIIMKILWTLSLVIPLIRSV